MANSRVKIKVLKTGKTTFVDARMAKGLIAAKRAIAVTDSVLDEPHSFKRKIPTVQKVLIAAPAAEPEEELELEEDEEDFEPQIDDAESSEKQLTAADSDEPKKRGRPKKQTYETKDLVAGE